MKYYQNCSMLYCIPRLGLYQLYAPWCQQFFLQWTSLFVCVFFVFFVTCCVRLSLSVQSIAWKDSSPKRPMMWLVDNLAPHRLDLLPLRTCAFLSFPSSYTHPLSPATSFRLHLPNLILESSKFSSSGVPVPCFPWFQLSQRLQTI